MAQDLMERLRQICIQIEEEKDAAISSLIDRLLARDDQKGSETDLREETAREKTATLALRRWLGPTVTQRLRAQYPLRPELFLAAVRLTEYYMEHQMTDQACALMDHLVTLSEERNRADPDRHREIVRRALWYTVDVNALLTCRIGDGQRRYYEGVADYNASRFFWFYAFALTAVGREREGIPLFRRCHELCLQVEGETSWIGARAGLSYHSAQMGRADTAASEAYLRDTLEKLEAEYSRRFPQTVQFTQLSFARVCEALGDGAALIEYYFARGEQTLSQPFVERSVLELDIFITKKTGGRAQLFHLKDPNGDEIVQQAIDFVALLQDPENVTGSGQKAALRGTLYRELLAPVVKHLEGVTTLYLAPHAELCNLPFEILYADGSGTLQERYELCRLECGRDLLFADGGASPAVGSLILGDPDYEAGGSKPRCDPIERSLQMRPTRADALPFSGIEAVRVSRRCRVRPCTGRSATKYALQDAIPLYDQYCRTGDAERLNDILLYAEQLGYGIAYRILSMSTHFRQVDFEDHLQEIALKLFRKLERERSEGRRQENIVHTVRRFYRLRAMDIIDHLAVGQNALRCDSLDELNETSDGKAREVIAGEPGGAGEDRAVTAEAVQLYRRLMGMYLRNVLSYDDQPQKPLALCYARILYQVELRCDPEEMARARGQKGERDACI